jgi:hypothetical protein
MRDEFDLEINTTLAMKAQCLAVTNTTTNTWIAIMARKK